MVRVQLHRTRYLVCGVHGLEDAVDHQLLVLEVHLGEFLGGGRKGRRAKGEGREREGRGKRLVRLFEVQLRMTQKKLQVPKKAVAEAKWADRNLPPLPSVPNHLIT